MKLTYILSLAAVALAVASPAFAQTADAIQYGDAIADVVAAGVEPTKNALTILVMGVLLKYAGPFGMLIRQNFVSDLIDKAVDFAYGATAGTMRGKKLEVSQLPEFMQNVVIYANGHFPWVLRFLIKSVRGLVEKALARVVNDLPEDFRYTQAFANEVEAKTGGIAKTTAPFSAALSKVGLVGA